MIALMSRKTMYSYVSAYVAVVLVMTSCEIQGNDEKPPIARDPATVESGAGDKESVGGMGRIYQDTTLAPMDMIDDLSAPRMDLDDNPNANKMALNDNPNAARMDLDDDPNAARMGRDDNPNAVRMDVDNLVSNKIGTIARQTGQPYSAYTAELAKRSSAIVVGKVQSIRSEWNAQKSFIWSFVTFAADNWIKEPISQDRVIEIKIPGGIVGDVVQRSSDEVTFAKNEKALVFLSETTYKGKKYFTVASMPDGKLTISENLIDGKPIDVFLNEVREDIKSE